MNGNCDCACATPVISEVPGSPGVDGEPGAAGTNGINSFSFLTEAFTVPAIGDTETAIVTTSAWMSEGQNIFLAGKGNFEVISFPAATSVELEYLDYTGNTHAGEIAPVSTQISPSGTEPVVASPTPIADGGTNATTKANAQTNLGLGQSATQDSDSALAFDITNSYTTIGLAVATPATGVYLILASITALYTGTTFAASRVLSMRIRNVTQSTTLAETTRETNITTTTGYPAIDYVLPITSALITAGDNLAIQVFLDTVESAGSSKITAGNLSIVPLALS